MMYNDAEYQKLIRTLSSDIQEDREGPYPIINKKIPDRDRPGDIDPRALALLQKLSADPGPETIDLTDLAPLRAAMNWKSLDITRMLLNVRHTSFFGRDGNRIRLRVYSPAELTGPLPCILYYHGGGWIGGEMAYVENACKVLAERASAVVVSVEYRFAPEHPFPAGFHDCCDALCHVFSHKDEFNIDPGKIAVSGDSACRRLCTLRPGRGQAYGLLPASGLPLCQSFFP